jgi:hypothetical protein
MNSAGTAPATLSPPDLKFRVTQSDEKNGITPETFEGALRGILDESLGLQSFVLKVTPLPSSTEFGLKFNGSGRDKDIAKSIVLSALEKEGLVNTLMDAPHLG